MGKKEHRVECQCTDCWESYLAWWRERVGDHDERVVRHIFETGGRLLGSLRRLEGDPPLEGDR